MMRLVTMIIKHVRLQLGLDLRSLRIVILSIRDVVLITRIIPTGVRAVILPIPTTQPAELEPAASRGRPARHVHASSVFLDRFAALWTFLGVGDHPFDVFRLVRRFLAPRFYVFARGWHVIADFVVGALEAPGEAARTRDGFFFVFAFDFDGVGAFGGRAEFDVWIIFYQGFEDKPLIYSKNGI